MPKAPKGHPFDWKGFLVLCGIFLLVTWQWDALWVLPLKLFVVLLHEMSHGIAALLTGGRVTELQIYGNQGGQCVTVGGFPFAVVSAGYLGSLFWGVAILLVATRTRWSQIVAALLGALVVIVALRFMPGDWRSGKGFAAVAGIVLAGLSLCPAVVTEMALRVIGVTSCLYVFLDIKHDVLDQDFQESDAMHLEQITHVPSVVWGLLWIGISVVVTVLAAKWAVTGKPKTAKPTPGKKAATSSSPKPR